MEHLKRIQNKNYHSKMDTGQLPTITYEVFFSLKFQNYTGSFINKIVKILQTLKYLESMPCKNQSKKRIIEYMTQMKHLNFTEEQCVMLVNNPPTTLVQLHLVIFLLLVVISNTRNFN